MPRPRIAYLFSRYPVVSQTFCDSEMLALEKAGFDLHVASLYPPKDSFRHERLSALRAPAHYPPPPAVLKEMQKQAERDGRWPGGMVQRHDREYGPSYQAEVRARNALWLAYLLPALDVTHCHVHFANRATHTALFLKEISGITFSFTAHAQDFMVDLGSDALLAEMARAAEFTVAVSDFSLGLLRERTGGADNLHRVYNGLDPDAFPTATPRSHDGPLRIVSIGRLIEFKGFHHLIGAVARLRDRGIAAELRILGDGPWRERLETITRDHGVEDRVLLAGVKSQEEIKSELAAADVFALACIVDGKGASDILPTVVAEAMACGLPVVSCTVAGVPEMVIDGKTGLLAPPGDEDALADALARLTDPALATAFGEAGRMLACERFALDHTSAQLAALFPNTPATTSPPRHEIVMLASGIGSGASDLEAERQWAASDPRLLLLDPERTTAKGPPAPALEFFPDGIVLEAEWRARPDARAKYEDLRHQLGTAVDGEWFFHLARRALWLASHARKRGITLIHGARSRDTVTAWLAARLGGPRFTGALEPGHKLPRAITDAIAAEAAALATPENDTLLLTPPPPRTLRIGPIRHTREAAPVPIADRINALRRFFDAATATPNPRNP